MSRNHKAPQYNVACVECMKIHPSSSISGLQKEAEDRIAKESQNIDHERSFMNLTIHGLDVFGNPVVNHDKPETSLEERIYKRIEEVGAKVRRDRQEISVERGHNSKESVICEGIIFQVSHERSMEILAEDGMLDENGQIRKDRHLPKDGKMYSLFMDTYRFVCERFGADNVVGAYIHLDEYTPHMHVFVVPVTMKESRYRGEVRKDEFGEPIMKGVLDAKNIFSPSTIKQLWPDYAEYIEQYGVSKAEGKMPKGMYTEVATMDAVIEQKQELIRQKNEEISRQDANLEAKTLANRRLEKEISQQEEQVADLKSDVGQIKEQNRYLYLQIMERQAVLNQLYEQVDKMPDFIVPPTKGLLGYNTKEVDEYIKATESKHRVNAMKQIPLDDSSVRKEMWKMIGDMRPKVAEWERLSNDPDALDRKASEIREEQSREKIKEVALAVFGPDFKPGYFEVAPTYGGYNQLVTGYYDYGGGYRALHITPGGNVYSTTSGEVRDVSSANSLGQQEIWTSHGNVADLMLQLQIQRYINLQWSTHMRFTSFEKENTPDGVEYLFRGDNGRNYYHHATGNVYSSMASNIPTLGKCRERLVEGIWKAEILMKDVDVKGQSKEQGLKR